MENRMADSERVSNKLRHYQKEELSAVERVKKADAEYRKAKAERAEAYKELSGIRCGIFEFAWRMDYLEEHGKLP
jgi:hypothetical protein